MKEAYELFRLLVTQPLLVVPLLLVVGILIVAVPLVKLLMRSVDQKVSSLDWATTWPRIEAFVLLLGAMICTSAILWCSIATDLHLIPPNRNVNHPFGPEFLRHFVFYSSFMCVMFWMMSLVLRQPTSEIKSNDILIDVPLMFIRLFFANTTLWFVGLVGASAYVFMLQCLIEGSCQGFLRMPCPSKLCCGA